MISIDAAAMIRFAIAGTAETKTYAYDKMAAMAIVFIFKIMIAISKNLRAITNIATMVYEILILRANAYL